MTTPSASEKRPGRLLITGATGGMGSACALLAAEKGYDLLLADLSREKLEALAADCARYGGTISHRVLDIAKAEHKAGFIASLQRSSSLVGVVHTVGLSPGMADWQQIIAVDLVHTVDLLEQLRPHMSAGACAVGIASCSGHMCPADDVIESVLAEPCDRDFSQRLQALAEEKPVIKHPGLAYAYAKKALSRYVSKHAATWGRENKRIVSISPGLIATAMGKLEYEASDNFDAMKSHIALGRLGEAGDIAATALFLLSNDAAYITGCDILVDGGLIGSFNAGRNGVG